MKQNLNEYIDRVKSIMRLDEEETNVFSSFPDHILKTLKDNYGSFYAYKFDWNQKSDELKGPGEFQKWRREFEQKSFVENKAKVIAAVRSDLIHLRRKAMAHKRYQDFENEILSFLGHSITVDGYDDIINYGKFEEFVKERPKYKKAFDRWVELMEEDSKYVLMDMNSAHIIGYTRTKELYDFLTTL